MEKYVLGRIGLYFFFFFGGGGGWGEAELILRIWGAKEKYFQGDEEFSFRDLGRSMQYFQGSREHRPPPWGPHVWYSFPTLNTLIAILIASISDCNIIVLTWTINVYVRKAKQDS